MLGFGSGTGIGAMTFLDQVARRSQEINSLLCVGLDPHQEDLEQELQRQRDTVDDLEQTPYSGSPKPRKRGKWNTTEAEILSFSPHYRSTIL